MIRFLGSLPTGIRSPTKSCLMKESRKVYVLIILGLSVGVQEACRKKFRTRVPRYDFEAGKWEAASGPSGGSSTWSK